MRERERCEWKKWKRKCYTKEKDVNKRHKINSESKYKTIYMRKKLSSKRFRR